MKSAIRIFALSVVVLGAAAASISSKTPHAFTSHQPVSAALPVPGCVPGMPGCHIANPGE